MRANRRVKIFYIWLAEVNLLVTMRALFPTRLEGELVLEVIKLCTYMAGLAIVGLSGVHMVYDWANGKLKKKGNSVEDAENGEDVE